MTEFSPRTALRSPRAMLDGYIILPRLIDKVRAYAQGALPEVYHRNLLRPGVTLDGRFLAFTGLDGEALRQVVLSSAVDEPVMQWIARHARPHSEEEKQRWASEVDGYRASGRVLLYLQATAPELAAQLDFSRFSLLDLIDMDEGRLPIPPSDESAGERQLKF
ncbi:MAG TPA: DUF5069 domain-containing protein [Nitrospira sp.]|nr:DUF5069 domain-containing protein [Nitrospira sp.]